MRDEWMFAQMRCLFHPLTRLRAKTINAALRRSVVVYGVERPRGKSHEVETLLSHEIGDVATRGRTQTSVTARRLYA